MCDQSTWLPSPGCDAACASPGGFFNGSVSDRSERVPARANASTDGTPAPWSRPVSYGSLATSFVADIEHPVLIR
jgi:hypothetical protein